MALSGLHVACGFVGASAGVQAMPVLTKASWSQTMASAGTTTNVAPDTRLAGQGDPVMDVISSVDAYVAFGTSPDATVSPRSFVPANTARQFYVASGDKLAWVAA